MTQPHYSGLLANAIRRALIEFVDQRQANATYGVHQLRVRLPDDPTVYRVLIAPSDAPIMIGGVGVDAHFAEPIEESE